MSSSLHSGHYHYISQYVPGTILGALYIFYFINSNLEMWKLRHKDINYFTAGQTEINIGAFLVSIS